MQQRFRRLALFVGATTLATGGLFMLACGTDNGTTPVPPPPEASTNKDTGGGNDGGPGSDGSVPDGSTGADADCSKNPVLHDNTTGFRCPFIDAGGADAGSNCTNDQTCCETSDKVGSAFQPSYCTTAPAATKTTLDAVQSCKTGAVANNSSFDAGNAWQCEDKFACGAGQVCCMIADPGQVAMGKTLGIGNTLAADKNHPPACGVQRAFNEGGSRCRTGTTCPGTEKILCSKSDMNCVAPTTCTPFVDFQQTHHGTCL
jgi:hypothetical protein